LPLSRRAIARRTTAQSAAKAPLCGRHATHPASPEKLAGIRILAVQAKDEEARRVYEYFDFIPYPDPMHLFVLLKDVRRIVVE
jgi:hypothetical protein